MAGWPGGHARKWLADLEVVPDSSTLTSIMLIIPLLRQPGWTLVPQPGWTLVLLFSLVWSGEESPTPGPHKEKNPEIYVHISPNQLQFLLCFCFTEPPGFIFMYNFPGTAEHLPVPHRP